MKLNTERKKLVVEGVKLLTVVGAMLALYLSISGWAVLVEKDKLENTQKSAQQLEEIKTLRSKIENSGSAKKLYATVVEDRKNEHFEIDNDQVREVLQELVKRHRLTVNGKLEYSTEKEFKHPDLASVTTPMIVRRDAKLKVNAISDMQVYAFMHSLSRELSGVIRFTSFKLIRKAPMDTQAITQLALGRPVFTVDAEISFDWFGFKQASESGQSAGNPPVQRGVKP
jgi:hypothetical protein